jgi:hypothetical protein
MSRLAKALGGIVRDIGVTISMIHEPIVFFVAVDLMFAFKKCHFKIRSEQLLAGLQKFRLPCTTFASYRI